MAKRRMFSKNVIGDESFLEMPSTAQNLYFHLGVYADDDGFISPQKICRMIGANGDDLKVLQAKGFVIPFQSGVVVMTHWRENNFIRPDRYTETIYLPEKSELSLSSNKYVVGIPNQTLIADSPTVYASSLEPHVARIPLNGKTFDSGIPKVYPGKGRLGKDRGECGTHSRIPTFQDIENYSKEVGFADQADELKKFFDYYEMSGWKTTRGNDVRSWKATLRNWFSRKPYFEKKQELRYVPLGSSVHTDSHQTILSDDEKLAYAKLVEEMELSKGVA